MSPVFDFAKVQSTIMCSTSFSVFTSPENEINYAYNTHNYTYNTTLNLIEHNLNWQAQVGN